MPTGSLTSAKYKWECRTMTPRGLVPGCALPPQYTLGRVAPGYTADLLILRPGANPFADVCVLAEAGGAAVAAGSRAGCWPRRPLRRRQCRVRAAAGGL